MRTTLALLTAILSVVLLACPQAIAQPAPANSAEQSATSSMRLVAEYLELGDFKTAKGLLVDNLEKLRLAGSAAKPISAQLHAQLGVVYILGLKDTKKAKSHFKVAIKIQKDIVLPSLADARSKVVFGRVYEALFPTIDCEKLMGLYHQPVPLAEEGKPAELEVKLGKHLLGHPMFVMYRGARGGSFKKASLEKVDECTYKGSIPGDAVNAPKVEYYLEARMEDGRPSARKGKSKLPFVVNVSFGAVDPSAIVEPNETETEDEDIDDNIDEEVTFAKRPSASEGRGCAGCSAGSGSTSVYYLLAFALLFLSFRKWRSRRRQA